jgi:hypothetical protein
MAIFRFALLTLLVLVLFSAKNASAQDTPYQITVVTSDLTRSDTQIALTNTGASATTPTNGGLCFNVYAMTSAQGDVAACCTCRVQPNGLGLISVNGPSRAGFSVEAAHGGDQAHGQHGDEPGLQRLIGRRWLRCPCHRHAGLAGGGAAGAAA